MKQQSLFLKKTPKKHKVIDKEGDRPKIFTGENENLGKQENAKLDLLSKASLSNDVIAYQEAWLKLNKLVI